MSMEKKNLDLFRAAISLAAIVFLVAACAKPECRTNSECQVKKCSSVQCSSGRCDYSFESNCCGNGIKDSLEDGKTGDKCTCPADYGKCEGKAKVKYTSKPEDAKYMHYFCNSRSVCVLGVEEKDVAPQNYLDVINVGYFKASSVVRFSNPFNPAADSFEFRMTLDDASNGVEMPIQIKGIKILYTGRSSRSELLIADRDVDYSLNEVGSEIIMRTNLNLNYKPQEVEEPGSFKYKLDYEYKKGGKTERSTFTSPSKQIYLVRNE